MAQPRAPKWRDKEKIGNLMTRLYKHATCQRDPDDPDLIVDVDGNPFHPMDDSQIRAASLFLKKTLPDLSAVELQGDDDKPLTMKVSWEK